jgi:hypothetical protein
VKVSLSLLSMQKCMLKYTESILKPNILYRLRDKVTIPISCDLEATYKTFDTVIQMTSNITHYEKRRLSTIVCDLICHIVNKIEQTMRLKMIAIFTVLKSATYFRASITPWIVTTLNLHYFFYLHLLHLHLLG